MSNVKLENQLLRNYQVIFILNIEDEKKAEQNHSELLNIFKNDKISEIIEEKNDVTKFAYKINFKSKGHYCKLKIKTTPAAMATFKEFCLLKQKRKDVVRFIIVNLEKEKMTKSEKYQKACQQENTRFTRPDFRRPNNFPRPDRTENREHQPKKSVEPKSE